jgi:hypothetical protein
MPGPDEHASKQDKAHGHGKLRFRCTKHFCFLPSFNFAFQFHYGWRFYWTYSVMSNSFVLISLFFHGSDDVNVELKFEESLYFLVKF